MYITSAFEKNACLLIFYSVSLFRLYIKVFFYFICFDLFFWNQTFVRIIFYLVVLLFLEVLY